MSTSQGYIFYILQLFTAELCNFTKKWDAFSSCGDILPILIFFKFHVKGERYIVLQNTLKNCTNLKKFRLDYRKKFLYHFRTITYICKGPYFSRMIVEYSDKEGKNPPKTVEGSGSKVKIPAHARDIKVRFQNQRFIGTWRDVKKYDRNKKCWCEPTEPHVFTFPEPVTRRFTLEGSLYYVAVMKITNEFDKDLDIME